MLTQFFNKLECEDKSQLYDFTTHKCVSECPCGFIPFRRHHTAYCAAGEPYVPISLYMHHYVFLHALNIHVENIENNLTKYYVSKY